MTAPDETQAMLFNAFIVARRAFVRAVDEREKRKQGERAELLWQMLTPETKQLARGR